MKPDKSLDHRNAWLEHQASKPRPGLITESPATLSIKHKGSYLVTFQRLRYVWGKDCRFEFTSRAQAREVLQMLPERYAGAEIVEVG